MQRRVSDNAALVLIGHGATGNKGSLLPVQQIARTLRQEGLFSQVVEAFYKAEPSLPTVWHRVRCSTVFIAPVTISEGYFTTEVIPRALGLRPPASPGRPCVQQHGTTTVFCCPALGSHPQMTDLVIHRVLNLLRAQAGEAPPPLTSTALFLAGHGTPRNRQSRVAIERQVDVLAQRRIFGEVHPAFMLEPPFIADCWQDTQCADLVMVPYFIADGMHTQEDIPILLGEPQSHLRTRLAAGAPGYPNPLRRGSQRLWLTPALGTDPSLVNVVLEQVAEAQAEALALPPPGATG